MTVNFGSRKDEPVTDEVRETMVAFLLNLQAVLEVELMVVFGCCTKREFSVKLPTKRKHIYHEMRTTGSLALSILNYDVNYKKNILLQDKQDDSTRPPSYE
jgi:hypothetical protein